MKNGISSIDPLWVLVSFVCVLALPANADRIKKYEFSLQVSYLYGETIDFEGGAAADIASDPGFGFTAGYNYSNKLNLRASLTWNDTRYDGQRVIDDGNRTVETISSVMDTFSCNGVADYYFIEGRFTPFVSGMIGWTSIDSNIAAAYPEEVCWWGPWWGYVCDYYQPTYGGDSFSYGVGGGLRLDLSPNHFVCVGYYERWIDVDYAESDPALGTAIFEFGFMY